MPTVCTAITRHLGHVCERMTGTRHGVHSENILGKERPADKMFQSHGSQSFSRGTIKGEGHHGNSFIIFWDHVLRMRSEGCPRPAEGQSHDCICCPVSRHSSTVRSWAGKR